MYIQDDDEDQEEVGEDVDASSSKTPIASSLKKNTDQKYLTQMKNEKKPTFSPNISPINGLLPDNLRDSQVDTNENNCWMDDRTYSYQNQMSTEKVEFQRRNHLDDSMLKTGSLKSQYSTQMPLQMQSSQHLVFR